MATARIRYQGPEPSVGMLVQRLRDGGADVQRVGERQTEDREIQGIADNVIADLIVMGSAVAIKQAVAWFSQRRPTSDIEVEFDENG